jgi:single-strand DNA-binding protein
MIDALISGKLIKDCPLKTSQNDKLYCQFLLSVSTGDTENTVISGIAFGDNAERIAKFAKGDTLAVCGALKPTEWEDRNTGETRHGLSVSVSGVLSVYDIKKRRPKPEVSDNPTQQDRPFNDPVGF